MPIERCTLKPQWITAEFAAAEANRDNRTIPLTWYSGATVLQMGGWEEGGLYNLRLSMDPAHVHLEELNSGNAPLTRGHASTNDPTATIGVVERAAIQNGKGIASVRFSKRADVEPLYQDVLDRVLTNVSIGARIARLRDISEKGAKLKTLLAISWTPFAIAMVGVPADPAAHFTAAAEESNEVEIEFNGQLAHLGVVMENETNAVETARETEITKIANLGKLDATFAAQHIEAGTTVEQFRALAFEKLAARSAENATVGHRFGGGRDRRDGMVSAMAEAITCRFTGQAPGEQAREFAGASLADMAREICITNGLHVTGFGSERFIKLAMGTSDFPHLLTETGSRMLLAGYQAAPSGIKTVARRSTAKDFRTKSLLRLGETPRLEMVAEGGEITHGARSESKESYRIYEYARIYGLTRQALVNDDLGAWNDWMRDYGIAAANTEAQLLVDLLTSAAGLGPTMHDTVPLFDAAAHFNLAAGGTAISSTSLSAARAALRLSKGLDGVTVISAEPKYLLVPAALETVAQQYLATLYPAVASNVNPFTGALQLIVEPRLDAVSAIAWYSFADAQICPVLEYAYLEGAEGPQIDSRPGFDILGTEFRCVLSYGVGAIGWRGVWRNPGA